MKIDHILACFIVLFVIMIWVGGSLSSVMPDTVIIGNLRWFGIMLIGFAGVIISLVGTFFRFLKNEQDSSVILVVFTIASFLLTPFFPILGMILYVLSDGKIGILYKMFPNVSINPFVIPVIIGTILSGFVIHRLLVPKK